MTKTPKFIVELKSRTIMSKDRSVLVTRPLNEKRSKLREIAKAESVSEQKLVEFAIELLWEKYQKERKAG